MLNGIAWRALPSEFGRWLTVFQFLNRLSLAGFFEYMERLLITGDESEAVFIDSTHCRAHQHATNGKGSKNQGVGVSRGGPNTKLHIAVDAVGRLAARMLITTGNTSDHTAAPELTADLTDVAVVGDKGYDSKKYREDLRGQGCEPCIPARKNVKNPEPYDKDLYKTRHCVENKFQSIKLFRRIATRFEKTKRMFFAFVTLGMAADYEKQKLWESK